MHRMIRCAAGAAALLFAGAAPSIAAPNCNLGSNGVKHIVYLQFDNVHLHRDNPNVPSDLEQIPNLLNFLEQQGTLLTNHHTPLISHTAVDITTSLTGVYGEKFGFGVGNSFGFFDTTGTPRFQSSFAYWTDVVNEGTTATPVNVPQMVDQSGKVHPAPWVPFTRAGCDFGAFSIANIEFENTTSDVDNVFGPTSPEHAENIANHALALADFEGIAIHCAQGSPLCSGSPSAKPDVLNDEPGGYVGFQALFGNKYVAPAINHGNGYVLDLDGNHITDGSGHDGFPAGFSPAPSQTLGYAAQMLEAGVPVVYLYIEDAHDNHNFPGAPTASYADGSFGPGEANYVYQLKAYDKAFGQFFARLAADGITKDNTLFVITADENDHFAGSVAQATPAGCNGVSTLAPILSATKGEVDADLRRVYNTEFNNTTPFSVHVDDAPTVYINGNPTQTDSLTRTLEQQAATLLGYDPIIAGDAKVAQALADQAEATLLHMVSHDPARTPNFTLFGNPDYFLSASSTSPCTPPTDSASCFVQSRNFVWNHGDFQKDIVRTWLGIVGPGVRQSKAGPESCSLIILISDRPCSVSSISRTTMLMTAASSSKSSMKCVACFFAKAYRDALPFSRKPTRRSTRRPARSASRRSRASPRRRFCQRRCDQSDGPIRQLETALGYHRPAQRHRRQDDRHARERRLQWQENDEREAGHLIDQAEDLLEDVTH